MADRMGEKRLTFVIRFPKYISALTIGFGLMVLTGWILHIQRLKGLIPGQVAVKANAAVCYVLIGMALWLALSGVHKLFIRVLSRALALMAGVIGLLSFLEYAYGWDLGIDQLLFKAGPDDMPGSIRLGLMSPLAAADFLLLGITIIVLDLKASWSRLLRILLPAIAAVVAMFGALDFVLDPQNTHTHIAPMTALLLFFCSFAALCGRTDSGLGAVLVSDTFGGLLCRRLLPSSILIPIGIAWLRWRGQQVGLYSEWTGLAIMTVSAAVLLAGLTLWTAVALERMEGTREQAEESVRRLAAIVTWSNDAIIGKTLDGIVTSWNPGAEAIYGYSAEEMMGHPVSSVVPPELRDEFNGLLRRVSHGEAIRPHETERIRKDGKRISVSLSISPVKNAAGTILSASTIARDISERKKADEKFRRVNQTLSALSACTEQMMRASDESAMLRQVCDAVIRVGGYRMAWIGYAEHDENKTVRPVASAGAEDGYLGTVQITWADVERGRGPTGTAVRTGKTVVSHDFANDPSFEPWRQEAARRDYRCSIVLPLRNEKQFLGAISIYSANEGTFDTREQQLLEQLASNLSYAIMTLRAQAQRDRSEQKLRESALYVRRLLEASLDPLVTISKDGKITDLNEATEKATGFGREHLIGSDFCAYFTEPERAREGYDRAFKEGLVRDYPLVIRNRSGSVMDVLYNATVFKAPNGEVEGVFAAARDVTERKRAEEALHRSESRYRSLVTATAQIVWTTDPEGQVVDDIPTWRAYTGMTREEIAGAGWLNSLHPGDRDRTERVWVKAWRNREHYDTEYRIRRQDGEYRTFSVRGVPVLERDGSVREWVGTCTDITERKRAVDELQLSRERLALAQKAAHSGTFDWDMQNNVNLWTPEVEEVHGLAPGEFGGTFQDWERLVFPEDLAAAKANIESSLRTGEFAGEWRIRRRNDGQIRWVTARAKILNDDKGKPWRMIGLNMDVTERKQAEEEVRRLNDELEQRVVQRTAQLEAANKELEAFTYSVSHDLRAPLRHISGFSKILAEEFAGSLPPEAQHHVQRIQEGTRRMGQLVDDLLNLGRVGRKELSLQVAGIRSIVDEVLSGLQTEVGERKVEWKISDLPYVECDTALIQQVFQNLLSNALKFTRPRALAVIEIGQERRDGTTVVYVRDNGVGFSMKYADKLFGVFQRLHRAEDFEGTGVGLATVQRIIRKHGGRIWAEAELDKGASFYFTLGSSDTSGEKAKAIAVGENHA